MADGEVTLRRRLVRRLCGKLSHDRELRLVLAERAEEIAALPQRATKPFVAERNVARTSRKRGREGRGGGELRLKFLDRSRCIALSEHHTPDLAVCVGQNVKPVKVRPVFVHKVVREV